MRRVILGVVFAVLCGAAPVYAGEWSDAGAKVWTFTTSAFVVADKVLHWSWEVLHNKIVHPTVSVVTLGTVNLSTHPTP